MGEVTYASLALMFLPHFLPICPLKALWYDEEIKGRKAEQEFETAVQRCNRALYPTGRLKLRSRKSHTSDLIQLADVFAYTLLRQTRGVLSYPPLERLLREIETDKTNLIIRAWETNE